MEMADEFRPKRHPAYELARQPRGGTPTYKRAYRARQRLTQRDGSNSREPIAYYACVAIEDIDFEPTGPERSVCDHCRRETAFDPESYALAARIGEVVVKLCLPCLERAVRLGEIRPES